MDMVDIQAIRTTVKLIFPAIMARLKDYCCCCYAVEMLGMLCSPELDAYKLICDFQGMNNDNNKIVSCLRCREFLKEIHHFRIELNVKSHEKILKKANDDHSSLLDVKTEVVDEHNEVDFNPEGSQLILENIAGNDSSLLERNNVEDTRLDELEQNMITKSQTLRKKENSNGFETYKCSKCSYMAISMKYLKQHLSYEHNDEMEFSCNQCSYTAKKKGYLTRHIKIHLNDCDKPHKCNKCSYRTTTTGSLKTHFTHMHNDERLFPCEHCNYCGKTKSGLNQHMKSHSKRCSICSYTTKFTLDLREHIASMHSGGSEFICEHCNYGAKTKSNLTNHMKVHMKNCDRPYKCSECSYKAAFSFTLKEHIQYKHSDERPFSCKHCNYSSKTKSKLNRHMNIHAKDSDNPYKCSQCSYTTAFKSNLKSHVIYKHNDVKSFPCEHCNRCFKTIYVLSGHIKKEHTEYCEKF